MKKLLPVFLLAFAMALTDGAAAQSRSTSTSSQLSSSNSSSSSSSSTSRTSHSDQDEARDAVRKGKIMPLTAILVLPIWGAVGLLIYFLYSRSRSHVGRGVVDVPEEEAYHEVEPPQPGTT